MKSKNVLRLGLGLGLIGAVTMNPLLTIGGIGVVGGLIAKSLLKKGGVDFGPTKEVIGNAFNRSASAVQETTKSPGLKSFGNMFKEMAKSARDVLLSPFAARVNFGHSGPEAGTGPEMGA